VDDSNQCGEKTKYLARRNAGLGLVKRKELLRKLVPGRQHQFGISQGVRAIHRGGADKNRGAKSLVPE